MAYRDRFEAGRRLAEKLMHYRGVPDVIVLALPRGGVPVAFEVASALQAPLDVFLVRKLGVPGREELAMGAVATGGVSVLDEDLVRRLGIPPEAIEEAAARERAEIDRQRARFRHGRPAPPIAGCTIILIDDGLATGSTMRAAVQALREQRPRRIVVAVPVGAADTCTEFTVLADEVVCAIPAERFMSVGAWYADFRQTTDEEVVSLLDEAEAERAAGAAGRLVNP
jgi:predicted phosphoribosyltransferase